MPDRWPWVYLAAILVIYVTGYVSFPADVFTSTDESAFVEQAVVFAGGSIASVSPYPPGTSLLQAPFVAMGGWRAAAWVSLLAAAVTVLLLARWLRDAGYNPAFALLFLAYAPTLVMARIATSEVLSAAVVTLALWLFWSGERAAWRWAIAGWTAGLSILLRETNLLLFLPFVVAAAARRRAGWRLMTAALVAGCGTAVCAYWFTAGTLPGLRPTAGFAVSAVGRNIWIYAVCLLVLVPGGLVAVAGYRGFERRAVTAAVAGYLAVYLFYDYSGQDSAPLARIAATGRYLIPLVPLVTIAWTDSLSRLVSRVRFARTVATAGSIGIAVAAFAVHPVLSAWSAKDSEIVARIAATVHGGALIADDSQRKYVAPMLGRFSRYWMIETSVSQLPSVTARHPSVFVVNIDRSETTLMHTLSMPARNYVEAASRSCHVEPVVDRTYGDTRRLQIWRVSACGRQSGSARHARVFTIVRAGRT
jgi:hypothetical protein